MSKPVCCTDFSLRPLASRIHPTSIHNTGFVAETKESVLITKQGKPLVEVVPVRDENPRPGKLANALVFEDDILSPLGEAMWSVCS